MNKDENIYESGEYLKNNPSWDLEDSEWKANEVIKVLKKNQIQAKNIVEVGCGAGGILSQLQMVMTDVKYCGYDISKNLKHFWEKYKNQRIEFFNEDFLKANTKQFDVLLLLDVIEHVPDPIFFLKELRGRSSFYILHIPLDLSSISVAREKPLLNVRSKVGHLHYFTKGLAFALINECGYKIIDWHYTGVSILSKQNSWKTRIAAWPRRILFSINRDFGVRLLGGDTLMVLMKIEN